MTRGGHIFFALIVGLAGLAAPSLSPGGEFRVTPIRLIFDQQTKTGILTIQNDGEETLQLQVKAYEWTQDERGKDRYTETDDILFFPRLMKLEKAEKRILRAGVKQLAREKEQTYRLFIEEVPEPQKKREGASIDISIRFGVPIFVKPVPEEVKGAIEKVQLGEGKLRIDVRNTGNAHFRIESIQVTGTDAQGTESFSRTLSGWYLLAGTMRSHELSVSREECRDTARFVMDVKTLPFTLHDQLDVIPTLCSP
ncbi:MAG: fimbria/pilus periplasmic chaperone [Nitrospirota bacterium]